ncbi:MAG: cobalt-precorrin-4/precorrin-4 C(11)-methyltransferase [Archaeoglobaceae archaeon]|nr:cobalt-precorrin-4/precorrin-4 C(11)-methyltransferase [Archaeoglobaceae archaeon]MCX8152498.1 cobalt-precorrin-4/precorrin-4 C(11)-methyltransferase [Archaeoglobaceae archaeon]MDW8013687.1 cobalt-precorrin-4/precorrin-4 C(11)-methyltransferase [Archaeoglobaceae archaeon]
MKVYFVGFGPGDPELLTVKGYKILSEAEVIFYPGSIIPEESLSEFKALKINTHGMKLEKIVSEIEKFVKEGKKVVRVQSGDPSIYSALKEQIEELEKRGIECEVIPGVSSVFAAAAKLKAELATSDVPTLIVTRAAGRTLEKDEIEKLAETNSTLVFLLSAAKIEDISKRLLKVLGDVPAAVAYKVTQKEEKIIEGNLSEIAEKAKGIERMAVFIVGKALKSSRRSYLYA